MKSYHKPRVFLTRSEREARRTQVTLDNSITKKMTYRDRPVTVNDLFALQKEVILMGKLYGFDEAAISNIYKCLKGEITSTHGHYSSSLRSGWSLSISEFTALTPCFKNTFTNCSKDNMKTLLLSIRKDILDGKIMPRRWSLKRKNNRGTKPIGQETTCENKERLTPLSQNIYKQFIEMMTIRRYGWKYYEVEQNNYRDTYKNSIDRTGLTVTINDKTATPKNWKALVKKNIEDRNVLKVLRGGEK